MERRFAHPKPGNLIQTIERASSILDLVGRSPRGMSIKDLSIGLDLPKGTVHRILSSLSFFGFIRQDPDSKDYLLGFKLMELGALLGIQLDLGRVAEPVLWELAEKTGETVHMVMLDMGEVVYIGKTEPLQATGSLKMVSRVGTRIPPHCCAVGKALIAHLSPEDLDGLIREKGLQKRTANTITDPDRLKEHLRMVRRQGYAVDDEENELGIRCVAATILDGKGEPVAAVSVSGPALRVTQKLIRDVLKGEVIRAASEISRRLGFMGGEEGRAKGGR